MSKCIYIWLQNKAASSSFMSLVTGKYRENATGRAVLVVYVYIDNRIASVVIM